MDGWQFMTRSLSVPPHSQALTPCQSASSINSIHAGKTLPRRVVNALAARLRVMPAVVLSGARQTAKSTLVERLVQGGRRYRTLDDFDVLDAARRDPEALLGG
jgi:predicted AAA+ superfamily ATPase